jgi:rhamnose transport system ATP-binding protein
VRAVFGIDRYDSGSVRVGDAPLPPGIRALRWPAGSRWCRRTAGRRGCSCRHRSPESFGGGAGSVAALRFGASGRERALARGWGERLRLRYSGADQPVERLSGGNQQKVVLAKWLATEPELLVIDEPTRGIDVGTKAEVHRMLSQRAAEGLAVLMVSSELLEVLAWPTGSW